MQNTKHVTAVLSIIAVVAILVVLVFSGIYFTESSCAQHANTSQRCVSFGPLWKVVENSNSPYSPGFYPVQTPGVVDPQTLNHTDGPLIDRPLPKYSSVDECSKYANTAMKCVQDPADKLWYVISSNHP